MQYFHYQQQTRQLSRRLVLLFVVGMLSVTSAISLVMLTLAATLSNGWFFFKVPDTAWLQQHPAALISTMLLVWGVTGSAVLLKRIELRGGGGAVARALGGERVAADNREPLRRRLHNVVEEMSIASGVPLPEVYLLPREAGINAFAAGLDPASAAIAVTQGALELLSRDELQGVVAHEFSHILNNDIRLNQSLIAWLHGLMALSVMGRGLWQLSTRNEQGRRSSFPPVMFAAAAIVALGYVGMLFGRLIQAAVARRRESLADASALQFTRNPDGLRNALLKIAAASENVALREVSTDEFAHLLFLPPQRKWFATHPSLPDRIRALGGSFDAAEVQRMRMRLTRQPVPRDEPESESEFGPELAPSQISAAIAAPVTTVLTSVGTFQASQLQWAQQMRLSLPQEVQAAAAQTELAVAFIFALAMAADPVSRDRQTTLIKARLGAVNARNTCAMLAVVDRLQPLQRQAALQLLLPQLRQLPEPHRLQISSCLNAALQLSGVMSVQAFALRKLVQVQLHDASQMRPKPVLKLNQVSESLQHLLALLACQGHASQALANQAFERAMQTLGLHRYAPCSSSPAWPQQLDRALLQLDQLHPAAKQMLLEAMMVAVAHDGQLTMPELELLRVFCACLHVPLPVPLANAN